MHSWFGPAAGMAWHFCTLLWGQHECEGRVNSVGFQSHSFVAFYHFYDFMVYLNSQPASQPPPPPSCANVPSVG